MSNNLPQNILYELQGKSLEAAKELDLELRKELDSVDVQSTGNMGDIRDSWQAMYQGFMSRLKTENPALLEQTGLSTPSTVVYKGAQTFPRAYEEYANIFTSPEENPRYFMYVPVGYDGEHFAPEDGREITDSKEDEQIGNLLFAGGWLGNAPIVSTEKIGVATPSDYVAPSASVLKEAFSASPNDRVVFLAKGDSLKSVEDYNSRKEDWQAKIEEASEAIKLQAEELRELMTPFVPEGEEFSFSVSYSYQSGGGEKATILLSARMEGTSNMMLGGKLVSIPQSPAFNIEERDSGRREYVVTARTDTPEGQALAKFFDAIPHTPGLSDYPDLISYYGTEDFKINDSVVFSYDNAPQLVELEGYNFLLYHASPETADSDFTPPDAAKIPTEVYQWLDSDRGDRNLGATPPPMPDEVRQFLDSAPSAPQGPAVKKAKPK